MPSVSKASADWLPSMATMLSPYAARASTAPVIAPTADSSLVPGFQKPTRPESVPNATVPPPVAIAVTLSPPRPLILMRLTLPRSST